jgi:hypothetical protein
MESVWRGPALKTLLLRSGLGFHMRRRECLTGATDCKGCERQPECWYAFAFDSPAALYPEARLTRLDDHTAHPYYFASAPTFDSQLTAGTLLPCLLTLFGRAEPLLNRLLASLEEAGRSGRWGGRFRIRQVISPLVPAIRLDGGQCKRESPSAGWPAWRIPERCQVNAARLRFLSPLRLRIQGTVQRQPAFPEMIRALLRRIHVLAGLYGAATLPDDWKPPFIDQASRAVTLHQEWTYFREDRRSGRQHRRIPIDGVLGELTVAGDLTALWPFLDVGQWIGMAASTGHGLGAYVLDAVDLDHPGIAHGASAVDLNAPPRFR